MKFKSHSKNDPKLFIPDGTPILPIEEALKDPDNVWESTLEEDLLESNSPTRKEFHPGDIVMVDSFTDIKTNETINLPHRIFIITDDGSSNAKKKTYFGYMLSSKVDKASFNNLENSLCDRNIYIDNYGSILRSGNGPCKECIIRLDNIYSFQISNVSGEGYKGTATKEFMEFIQNLQSDIQNGKSISGKYWISK